MRTRSKGRVSPEPLPADIPAQRRKRSLSADGDKTPSRLHRNTQDVDQGLTSERDSTTAAVTPRRSGKRVRFSDLGPEVFSSTGLTPFVRRATLSPAHAAPRRTLRSPLKDSRRFSLPPSLPSTVSSELCDEVLPSVEQVQFTPLREVLGNRIRRRLRRSHLSEELNSIEAEHRAELRDRTELQRLQGEDAKKAETIRQLLFDLEAQRLFGIEVNGEEERRIEDLKIELEGLRQIAIEEPARLNRTHANLQDSTYEQPNDDSISSPWEDETFFSSPTRNSGDRAESPLGLIKVNQQPVAFDASCQATLPVQNEQQDDRIREFEDAVRRLTKESSDAKTCINMIWSELRTLGFTTEQRSTEDMLQALRDAFRSTRLQLEHLMPGETRGGTNEGALLLDAMLAHIKSLLAKAHTQQRTIDCQQQSEAALRGQFNATVQRAADLEARLGVVEAHRTELFGELSAKGHEVRASEREIEEKAVEVAECRQRIAELEAQAGEQGTSVERLQAALETYRGEVASLEKLVERMEGEMAGGEERAKTMQGEAARAGRERDEAVGLLRRLREDVQEGAWELAALARPGLKENVTLRAVKGKRDSAISMEADGGDAEEIESQ